MRRPEQPDIDPADLPPPAVIARQIQADLKAALREIEAVARALEQPTPVTPEDNGEQLALDL